MQVRPNDDALQFNHLSPAKEYDVIGLNHDNFRVVDDKGEPVLFSRNIFDIVDNTIPLDWIWDRFSDDEYYASPPELHGPGFFEDFFDGKDEAFQRFQSYLKRMGKV